MEIIHLARLPSRLENSPLFVFSEDLIDIWGYVIVVEFHDARGWRTARHVQHGGTGADDVAFGGNVIEIDD